MSDILFRNKFRVPTIRLPDRDYGRDGLYFVTICTNEKRCILGEVIRGKMILNEIGETVERFWQEIPKHFPGIYLLEYVVMPNHLHGIIEIRANYEEYMKTGRVNFERLIVGEECRDKACLVSTKDDKHYRWQNPGKGTLSTIVGSFKSACTRTINQNFSQSRFSWQSNYFEHIIRNEKSLENIIFYIHNNPLYWQWDKNNPINFKK